MKNKNQHRDSCDYLIIGAGIIGLAIAKALHEKEPGSDILIIEKEDEVGAHGSGRNSGVLHAGFYYTANSLKARFAREGNARMTAFCKDNNLPINPSGKVVVAKEKDDLPTLEELKKRGDKNGVELHVIDEKELAEKEPMAFTFKKALFAPTTATVEPKRVCEFLADELKHKGVRFHLGDGFAKKLEVNTIVTSKKHIIKAGKIINAAGLYADKVARQFGFGRSYTIIPFKGIYLKDKNVGDIPVKRNIYPVPNIKNPFLGVHFTTAVDGHVKLGPTAIPGFWRESYKGMKNFKPVEMATILSWEALLFMTNAFGFRKLAFEEMKKYNRKTYLKMAEPLVKDNAILQKLTQWTTPGIRAQLLNKKTKELVQDFVVESDQDSIHILNAVSPAYTAAFPFGEYVVEEYVFK